MLVGCSQISVSVFVKHVQLIRIFKAFCLLGALLSFSVPGAEKNVAGLWFASGDQYPG